MNVSTAFQEGAHRLWRSEEGFYFGGTSLLQLFMDAVAREAGGRLYLISPFMDDALFASNGGLLTTLNHPAFAVTAITATEHASRAMAERIGGWKWAAFQSLWHPKLHGKMYLFRANSQSLVAMIGSHNLTAAGLRANLEIGVLIRGRANGKPPHHVFESLEAYADTLRTNSRRVRRSTREREHPDRSSIQNAYEVMTCHS